MSHGGSNTREYRIWASMVQRCNNPNAAAYPRYGGRGIALDARWHLFANFIADMGPRPTASHQIERQDNDGPYSPGNCRWATRAEQNRNRSDTQLLTHNGRTLCLRDWAAHLGMAEGTLRSRVLRGWPVERALTQEVRT